MNIGNRVGLEWENERIPTFEEILELCKNKIGIYLDLKEADVKTQVEIIKKYGMERNIIWYISADEIEIIKEVEQNCYKCLPMPDPGQIKNIEKIYEEIHPFVIATDMGELNEEYMSIAKKLNLKVIVDEDNSTEEEWEKMFGWGVDGIQTDNPERLINYLKKNEEANVK